MSAYNLKVIRYNGFMQLRIYSRPIKVNDDDTDNVENKKDELYQIQLSDGAIDEEDNKKVKNSSENTEKHSQTVSLNRTIQNIYDYTLNNNWDWFVTLTFRDDVLDKTDYAAVMRKACQWVQNIRKRFAPDMKYILVPEKHKSGAYHIHALFANCGDMSFTDSGRVAVGKKAYVRTSKNEHYPWIYNIDNWKNGWSTATKVQSSVKCASYITKYITKELCISVKGMRRFYPSTNLEKSEKETYNLPYEEIEELLQAYDVDYMKVQHIPEAGQTIKYITVKI